MEVGFILDLFGQAFWLVVLIVTALVLPGLIVGLIVAVLQAATQINEQTLSFLPRLLATLISVILFGPWIVQLISDLFNRLFTDIPFMII